MDPIASSSSFPSLAHFEAFIEQNPAATNIGIANGCIVSDAFHHDLTETKEAFKQALRKKYPEQEKLVDQAFDGLKASGSSWGSHVIQRVIEKAEENAIEATWTEIEDEEPSQEEEIAKITEAADTYAQQVVEGLSPEQQESLSQQLRIAGATGLAGGAAFFAAGLQNASANTALAHLLTGLSASLSSATVPLSAGHIVATASLSLGTASAAVASAATTSTAISSVETTIMHAAPAIATFIVAGAIAHRLYIATSRVARSASSIEHEINNISTAMIAAALATIPPAQHGLLLGGIIGSITAQHLIDPGVISQTFHNVRDAALGVYLYHHPDIAIFLGEQLKQLLFSSAKGLYSLASSAAPPTAVATTQPVSATAAVATSSKVAIAAKVAPVALLPHAMNAMLAHGVSAATTAVTTTIAAHPMVVTSIVLGGACAAAYQYTTSSSTTQPQTT